MDGEFLKGKREELGLDVGQMAVCLGVEAADLVAMEAGAPVPKPVGILAQLVGSAILPDAQGSGFVNIAALLLFKQGLSAPLSPKALRELFPPFDESRQPHSPGVKLAKALCDEPIDKLVVKRAIA